MFYNIKDMAEVDNEIEGWETGVQKIETVERDHGVKPEGTGPIAEKIAKICKTLLNLGRAEGNKRKSILDDGDFITSKKGPKGEVF